MVPLRRAVLHLMVLLLVSSTAAAQTYVQSMVVGPQTYTMELRPNAALLMAGPADQQLTDWQPLPFAWEFYGVPVHGYAASDNGYITFDSTATESFAANRGAADAAAPNNAIYAFWDDFHLAGGMPQWSNEIRSITVGTAPHRAHVVVWVGLAPAGTPSSSSNTMSFGVALLESGGFAVVHIAGRHSRPTSGSIGCEGPDGSLATFVDGSPDIDYPPLSASDADDITYHFTYSDRRLDLAVSDLTLPEESIEGTPLTLVCTVTNLGADVVTSCELALVADGVEIGRTQMTNLGLASSAWRNIRLQPDWTPTTAGRHADIRVVLTQVNGGSDEQPDNDTLRRATWIMLGRGTNRRPLVEEYTGAWCGWCPDGAVQMQEVERAVPEAVLVSIHAGGTDAMLTAEGTAIADTYNPAYPTAMIDRVRFSDEAAVPIGRSRNAWVVRSTERRALQAPLSLEITPTYDSTSRRMDADITVRFVDHLRPGDLRLHAFVVEDRVVGYGRGYDQTNLYSGNSSYPTHPYYSESNPIVGFMHRHVLRHGLTGYPGDASALPSSPRADEERTVRFSWQLPTDVNARETKVVAFVSRHGTELDAREVLNAASAPLIPAGTSVEQPAHATSLQFALAPQPACDVVTLALEGVGAGELRVVVRDVLGREVHRTRRMGDATGRAHVVLDAGAWPRGSYLVSVEQGGAQRTRVLQVRR